MRFTQFLDQNCTPEWSRAYLDYRACNRQLGIIAARINGREVDEDELADSDDDLDNGPARPRPRRQAPPSDTGLRRRSTHARSSTPHLSLPESVLSLTARGTGRSSKHSHGLTTGASAEGHPEGSSLHPQRSIASSGSSTSPNESPAARLQVKDSKRQSSLHSDGSGNGVEDLRDEGGNSFMAAGSVRNQEGVLNNGGLKDEDDLFSPSAKDEKDAPHLASEQPTSPGAHSRMSKWLFAPTQQMLSPFRKSPAEKPHTSYLSPKTDKSVPVTSPVKADSAARGRASIASSQAPPVHTADSLQALYNSLYPDEYEFFKVLDRELDKVENFYSQRESNCKLRFAELREQMEDMQSHEATLREKYARWEGKMDTFVAATTQMLGLDYNPEDHGVDEHGQRIRRTPLGSKGTNEKISPHGTDGSPRGDLEHDEDAIDHFLERDRFQEYKRSLGKAINEFYRYLEILKNYRIVNLIGFRKALKKFERTTRIACLQLYSDDRISPCSFANGRSIDALMKKTEEMYAQHFVDGNLQVARRKLRTGEKLETFYETTYRGGLMVGLGLPAAVLAIVKFFDPEVRRQIPAYGALMVIYSAFYLPVFFTMLFQLNLDLWVKMRINYEFVMELTRPCLDHRCFHEIPAFLFMTLSYCFFFSFYRIAPHSVDPTTWPIAWLVFVCVFFLNPLPTCRRRSRWWFVRTLGHVVTPGLSSVKFTVFFIADILNSHTYTIQNVYFLGCVSAHNWPGDSFQVCSSADWPFALLASLAPLARLGQCLRRYWETRLPIHLLNGGKYLISILTACLHVWNRSRGFTHDTRSLVVWIIFAIINSIYTCTWDFVVDWSLCRPGQKGLRPDLAYPSRAFYYLAMVINVLVRFVWIWTMPKASSVPRLRSWVFALLEVIRRWVWNFFRVETEHLGNADAYRVTREVPLPYRKVPGEDDGQDKHHGKVRRGLDKIGEKLVGDESGRGPEALNVGARGRAGQREYEASRPGDDGVADDDLGQV